MSDNEGGNMSYDLTQAMRPGEAIKTEQCVFREIGPRGGRTKNYVALAKGRRLPDTDKLGNLWIPLSIHDLHAGLS